MPAWASGAWAPGAWAGTAWAEAGVSVPDVVGQTQEDGALALESAGFVVAVQTAHSSAVPAGTIISQQPAAGAEIPAGSTVTITVSLGDAPVSEDRPAGGYGLLNEYNAWRQRRAARQREEEAAEARAKEIADEVTREIAERLQRQEAEAQTRAEHERLREIARRYEDQAQAFGARIQLATQRAAAQGGYSAMEALARELQRLIEEEMFLMQAAVMILQNEGYNVA